MINKDNFPSIELKNTMRNMFIFSLMLFASSSIAQEVDVLNVESYQLPNGFTVFLNPDPTTSRVYGAVMVNAGAKHENPDATGMAHYLEHLLFKGTADMGTYDYEKEKPHLDKINELYDQLSLVKTADDKLNIQKRINEEAIKASKYGLPNEFNKLLKSIGSTGINAFTSYEMTFYHNSFPSHEINKWLSIYAKRFQNPVFRSFQSELEVVYEEKNRSQDNFQRKIGEKLNAIMYKNLPYGEWPVLGKVDHLKNPSINKMYDFFNKHYVANNMALILSGNFNPSEVKQVIAAYFGQLKAGDLPKLVLPVLAPFSGVEKYKGRITPIKVGFTGYRTIPNGHPDRAAMDVYENILSNESGTGLIDQMRSNNEVLFAGTIPDSYNDIGAFSFFYVPKILVGSLKKTERKILHKIQQIAAGDFDHDLLDIAKNELQISFQNRLDNVGSRGRLIGRAFNQGVSWEEYINYPQEVSKVTLDDLNRIGKTYFGSNRMKFISRTGFPKKLNLKKPPYKPSVTEQKESSVYAESFDKIESLPFEPKYMDFKKDATTGKIAYNHKLWVSKNAINDLFRLTISFKKGRIHDHRLPNFAGIYNHAGAGDYNNIQLKKTFAVAGVDYSVYATGNELVFRISGKEDALEKALDLLHLLMTETKIDETGRKSYLNEVFADRRVEKNDPNFLRLALLDYGRYGERSGNLSRLEKSVLKKVDLNEIKKTIKEIVSEYKSEITYYGKKDFPEISSIIEKKLLLLRGTQEEPFILPETNDISQNKIFLLHDKKAVQSQVYFYVKGAEFDPKDYGIKNAFNQYFGGGFTGLVLQEIREYRSLAYSTYGNFAEPLIPGREGRLYGFLGTQADKSNDAIDVMIDLIQNLPAKPERIKSLRNSLKLSINTDFPEPESIINEIINKQRMGYQKDPNINALTNYNELRMDDIIAFHSKYIKGRPIMMTIYGDKSKMDLEKLRKIGEVVEVNKKDIATF